MTLKDLPIGKTATIRSVGGEGALRQHFLDMGLIPHGDVTMVKLAPMGDPMELRIHSYELTLRLADAQKIEIENVRDAVPLPASERRTPVPHPGLGEGGRFHEKETEHPLPEGTALTFALAGNQNCGKTTLFNQLTGSNQHVGNFPGVTVDRKDGGIRGKSGTLVTDLPGIYSMSPYSNEELVTRSFLLDDHPRGIINIVDATNIERNLYLTMQLMELDIPMVLALNMMDEVRENGGSIMVNRMEEMLGIPVIPISAAKNEGIDELIEHALHVAKYQEKPLDMDYCDANDDGGAVHRCLHAIMHLIEDHAVRAQLPIRFAAAKLAEGDPLILEKLDLDENEKETLEHIVKQMEAERGLDRAAAIAHMRFDFIEKVCDATVVRPHESREHLRSVRIDRVLTGKHTAIPCFIGIMGLVFFLTFGVIGKFLSDLLSMGIDALGGVVDSLLTAWNAPYVLRSLIMDGVWHGVGSVLQFLPVIVTLFFFLSLLEDSGYMARVAFVMDWSVRPQHRADAHRLRLHRAGRHGEPHADLGARPQDDHSAHAVHELLGEAPDLCVLLRRLFPEIQRTRHDRSVLRRHLHGTADCAAPARHDVPRRGGSVRHGAAELPFAGREKRLPAALGQGEGLPPACVHGHFPRNAHHLVPSDVRPALRPR